MSWDTAGRELRAPVSVRNHTIVQTRRDGDGRLSNSNRVARHVSETPASFNRDRCGTSIVFRTSEDRWNSFRDATENLTLCTLHIGTCSATPVFSTFEVRVNLLPMARHGGTSTEDPDRAVGKMRRGEMNRDKIDDRNVNTTSGEAETSESDVPLACAATPSRSRRNDVNEEDGCRDSASETTPQRLWWREPKSQNNPERESITRYGTSRRDKQTMVGRRGT